MKVLSKKVEVNEHTFQPELVVTISMPMSLALSKENTPEQFVKELIFAMAEYDNNRNVTRS